MKDPKQIGSPWEPWWTYRAPQSFAITEKLDDNSKLGTNLNLFKEINLSSLEPNLGVMLTTTSLCRHKGRPM